MRYDFIAIKALPKSLNKEIAKLYGKQLNQPPKVWLENWGNQHLGQAIATFKNYKDIENYQKIYKKLKKYYDELD